MRERIKEFLPLLTILGIGFLLFLSFSRTAGPEELPSWYCVESTHMGKKNQKITRIVVNDIQKRHKLRCEDCYDFPEAPGIIKIEMRLARHSAQIVSGTLEMNFRRRGNIQPFYRFETKISPMSLRWLEDNMSGWMPNTVDQALQGYFNMQSKPKWEGTK